MVNLELVTPNTARCSTTDSQLMATLDGAYLTLVALTRQDGKSKIDSTLMFRNNFDSDNLK